MFISILGGGTSAGTKIQLYHLGGVHQPKRKCHLDLKSNFIILGGGYISSCSILLQLYNPGGGYIGRLLYLASTFPILGRGGVHRTFVLPCFNFSNPGQGGGYIGSLLYLSSKFPILGWGGCTSAGRLEKCKVYG